jgi:hypothetical protein
LISHQYLLESIISQSKDIAASCAWDESPVPQFGNQLPGMASAVVFTGRWAKGIVAKPDNDFLASCHQHVPCQSLLPRMASA